MNCMKLKREARWRSIALVAVAAFIVTMTSGNLSAAAITGSFGTTGSGVEAFSNLPGTILHRLVSDRSVGAGHRFGNLWYGGQWNGHPDGPRRFRNVYCRESNFRGNDQGHVGRRECALHHFPCGSTSDY